MAEEKKDQDTPEVQEEVKDQSDSEQSGDDDKKTYTLEEAVEIAQNTQKGISQLVGKYNERMDILEEKLQEIADKSNKETGAEKGDDEYLTVGRLKEVLNNQLQDQAKKTQEKNTEADKYVSATLAQLRVDGTIKNDAEEKEFVNFALKIQEPDILKAGRAWQEVKQAKEEARKEVLKAKTKQDEGSKVGTSSKGTEENKGINYEQIHNMDWSQL